MSFEVDYSYKITEGGSTIVDTNDRQEAEDMAYDYVRDTFPEAYDIDIEAVREVK